MNDDVCEMAHCALIWIDLANDHPTVMTNVIAINAIPMMTHLCIPPVPNI